MVQSPRSGDSSLPTSSPEKLDSLFAQLLTQALERRRSLRTSTPATPSPFDALASHLETANGVMSWAARQADDLPFAPRLVRIRAWCVAFADDLTKLEAATTPPAAFVDAAPHLLATLEAASGDLFTRAPDLASAAVAWALDPIHDALVEASGASTTTHVAP